MLVGGIGVSVGDDVWVNVGVGVAVEDEVGVYNGVMVGVAETISTGVLSGSSLVSQAAAMAMTAINTRTRNNRRAARATWK